MQRNVMIPLFLLDRIIELLEELKPSEYHSLRYEYCNILWALRVKKQKLDLRDAYAKIILADEQESRNEARIQDLQQKQQLDDLNDELPF